MIKWQNILEVLSKIIKNLYLKSIKTLEDKYNLNVGY